MSEHELELRAAVQARTEALSASRPAVAAARLAAATALAEQQVMAAWTVARQISKSSDGHLNFFNSAAGIAPILSAIVANMGNDHA